MKKKKKKLQRTFLQIKPRENNVVLLFCFLLKWLCFDVIRLMLEVKSERK